MNLEFLLLLVLSALVILILLSLANLRATRTLDGRVDDIDVRVARLEERSMTAQEQRQSHERMANMEGQLRTNNDMLRAIQLHLLEKDR